MQKSAETPETAPLTATAALSLSREREAAGDAAGAREVIRRLIEQSPTPANIAAAARAWEGWEAAPLSGTTSLRLAVIGTGTLGPLGAHLRVTLAGIGVHPVVHVGEFDQWAQELIDAESPVLSFQPEVIALSIDPANLFPRTVGDPFLTPDEEASERTSGTAALLRALRGAARNASQATIVLHTFAVPDYAPLGDILDAQMDDGGLRGRIGRLNAAVHEVVRAEFPRVLFFDQERIEARFGKARVRDSRRFYMASIPFSEDFLRVMALEYLRILRPLKGMTRKCVVLDLDNTLWGGVIGEDGIAGIKLGGTAAPGNAFRDFQRALDDLRKRGILLAVCSKNNPDDAMPVLEKHPEMILRPASLAAMRINWEDKATNIAAIARELNIGLDSLVFLDDNPAERGLVRDRLPQVLVPELPRDPAQYTAALRALDVFESITLTDEDRRRSELYAEQRQRRAFEERLSGKDASVGGEEGGEGLTDYLAELGIEVKLAPANPFTLPRIAQLINKTNQFNLTTRRYTEAEVKAMSDDTANWDVCSVNVSDRFGDSGLTGIAIALRVGTDCEIDSFLLSCRVLSRGIEQALLLYVADRARAAGADRMIGRFIPTAKNAPSADFYRRVGFTLAHTDENGTETWTAPLTGDNVPPALQNYSEWLTVAAE